MKDTAQRLDATNKRIEALRADVTDLERAVERLTVIVADLRLTATSPRVHAESH